MTTNISGYGLSVRVVASVSFPLGFTVTQFTSTTDPFDVPEIVLADSVMGINGDLAVYTKANPIEIKLSVVPNTPDDDNLQILLHNNRSGRGKRSVLDIITLTGMYPDGRNVTLAGGVMISGLPGRAVSSESRLKDMPYLFRFENLNNAT